MGLCRCVCLHVHVLCFDSFCFFFLLWHFYSRNLFYFVIFNLNFVIVPKFVLIIIISANNDFVVFHIQICCCCWWWCCRCCCGLFRFAFISLSFSWNLSAVHCYSVKTNDWRPLWVTAADGSLVWCGIRDYWYLLTFMSLQFFFACLFFCLLVLVVGVVVAVVIRQQWTNYSTNFMGFFLKQKYLCHWIKCFFVSNVNEVGQPFCIRVPGGLWLKWVAIHHMIRQGICHNEIKVYSPNIFSRRNSKISTSLECMEIRIFSWKLIQEWVIELDSCNSYLKGSKAIE